MSTAVASERRYFEMAPTRPCDFRRNCVSRRTSTIPDPQTRRRVVHYACQTEPGASFFALRGGRTNDFLENVMRFAPAVARPIMTGFMLVRISPTISSSADQRPW